MLLKHSQVLSEHFLVKIMIWNMPLTEIILN